MIFKLVAHMTIVEVKYNFKIQSQELGTSFILKQIQWTIQFQTHLLT